jgi:hypothetical protein
MAFGVVAFALALSAPMTMLVLTAQTMIAAIVVKRM